MEILLGTVCVCLFVFSAVFMWKYFSVKKNIRRFSKELEKLKDRDYRQPLKVSDFDKDIVELAVKINEHTDIQQKLCNDYEQSKKQLSTVISGISHDFRTPLTASLGYLQMIEKSGELSEKNAEYLGIAMQKNQYLKELSDDFFELTKINSKKDDINTENINLSNTITEYILEQHSWIAKRNVAAEFDITDGIIINTDVHFLTRILNNLMSNSQKYTDDRFSVSLKRHGEKTVLTISNTLSDSSSIDADKVFEPFYRMDARTADGSGLGLYVVKRLCGELGWTVTAQLRSNVFSVIINI